MADMFRFDPQGKFRVLQLTDLHYEDGGPPDQKMLRVVEDLIAWERPQFIMLTGDCDTNADSLRRLPEALGPVADSGLPFCYLFGNHDAEYGAPRPALLRALRRLPGCLNPPAPAGVPGYSNAAFSLGAPGEAAQWLLIGLDSGMYNQNPLVGGYDHVKPAQTAWYLRQLARRARQPGPFGALCFLHIPLPEYAEAFRRGRRIGDRLEKECSPRQNSGLYSALLDEGHTRGVFAGHDHINDYCADLHGVALCYGRAGGFSTYGRRSFRKGGRVIELTQGRTDRFETWLRLSDGSVKDRFVSSDLWPQGRE